MSPNTKISYEPFCTKCNSFVVDEPLTNTHKAYHCKCKRFKYSVGLIDLNLPELFDTIEKEMRAYGWVMKKCKKEF